MRSVIYGAIIAVFLASAGTVQAANDLDGKSLFCVSHLGQTKPCLPRDCPHTLYGLEFDEGEVLRWQVKGYSKVTAYKKSYLLDGTS